MRPRQEQRQCVKDRPDQIPSPQMPEFLGIGGGIEQPVSGTAYQSSALNNRLMARNVALYTARAVSTPTCPRYSDRRAVGKGRTATPIKYNPLSKKKVQFVRST